jgi:hypothetical protein
MNGKLVIKASINKNMVSVTGTYDCTPKSWADRISRYFQRLELIEKVAEIGDESFHLLGSFLQRHTNSAVYQTLRNLHHGAHDIEHVIHAFCFLGDAVRFFSKKFFLDREGKPLGYLGSLSRVCHAVAHFFETTNYLQELKLLPPLGGFQRIFKYGALFSTIGYSCWTIHLIWQHYRQRVANNQFASDMSIHVGGCIFESIRLTEVMDHLGSHAFLLNQVASLAKVVQAWFIVQYLMPKDKEVVTVEYALPDGNGKGINKHLSCGRVH